MSLGTAGVAGEGAGRALASGVSAQWQLLLAGEDWRESLTFFSYRLSTYLLLNVVEDPAWLAFALS